MHSVLGQMAVLLALGSAAVGSLLAFAAGRRDHAGWRTGARRATYLFAGACLLANAVMVRALLVHDFSVGYVAQVGSRATPPLYTIVSLWSSLEGSILFWGLIMGAYSAAFVWQQRHEDHAEGAYALGTLLAVCTFFAFTIAGPANPFLPVSPVPLDGPGPNPLLQNHVLMIIHPPMLYLGYVGLAVPFAIAIGALMAGRLRPSWLKVLRRWTLLPWGFLSVGIMLGAWWAYEVLGWGGYWAWDPVENASFLPWLASTAYLHASIVQERKGVLKAWTLSLVLVSFMLTILGTFMTRSGVFNSVHSFTQSAIGPVFLVFLAIILVVSIVLLVGRGHLLMGEGQIDAAVSREAAFVLNNLVFVTLTFTVLLGTIFPLLTEAVRGTKVSVGEPYFNRMATPLGLALVFLMGVAPILPWGQPNLAAVRRALVPPLLTAIATLVGLLVFGLREPLPILTFALCAFAAHVNLGEIILPAWPRAQRRQESLVRAWAGYVRGNRRRVGGAIVHLTIICIAAAVAGSQSYRQTQEANLKVGESMQLGPYTLTYEGASSRNEPHRFAVIANVHAHRQDVDLGILTPRLNYYHSQREPIGTPHVLTQGSTDLYLSMLSITQDGTELGLKVYLTPLVPWLWRCLPFLVLGVVVSMWPHRRVLVAP